MENEGRQVNKVDENGVIAPSSSGATGEQVKAS